MARVLLGMPWIPTEFPDAMLPNVLLTTADLPDAPGRAAGKMPEKKPAADLFGALLALWAPLSGTPGRLPPTDPADGASLPAGGNGLPPAAAIAGGAQPGTPIGPAQPGTLTGSSSGTPTGLTALLMPTQSGTPIENAQSGAQSGTSTGGTQSGTPIGPGAAAIAPADPVKGGPAAPVSAPLSHQLAEAAAPGAGALTGTAGAAAGAAPELANAVRAAAGTAATAGAGSAPALTVDTAQPGPETPAPAARDLPHGATAPTASSAAAQGIRAVPGSELPAVAASAAADSQGHKEESGGPAPAVPASMTAGSTAAPLAAPPLAAPAPAAASPGTPSAAPPAVPILPPIEVAPGSAGWDEALGGRVSVMARHDLQHAEVHLHPAELGPLRVQVSMDDGKASLHFHAHHPLTRDAIEQALPRLRDMLGEHGIALGQASVSGDGAHGHAQPEREPADGRGPGAVARVGTPARVEARPAPALRRDPSGTVDLFA